MEIDPDNEWFEESLLDVTPEECLKKFNDYRRPDERKRKLIAAIPIHRELPHVWIKHSLVTEKGGYDRYRCRRCGMFGKRHSLSALVVPDKKGPYKS